MQDDNDPAQPAARESAMQRVVFISNDPELYGVRFPNCSSVFVVSTKSRVPLWQGHAEFRTLLWEFSAALTQDSGKGRKPIPVEKIVTRVCPPTFLVPC